MAVSNELKPLSGINVTSLVDVTMSLLIMFMITVPLINEQRVRSSVAVPVLSDSAKSEVVPEDLKNCVISIDREGRIFFGIYQGSNSVSAETLNSPEDLVPLLRGLDPMTSVSIEADSAVFYKHVLDCVRTVAKSGINSVELVYTSKIR
ncbi:biopolymer transporter ExbD [candidate division WOR-3 bacterium]|nr:biopolymer transporter ExbD [candidate division WOR-3 bacterium]